MPDGFFKLKTPSVQMIAVFISIITSLSSLSMTSRVYAEETFLNLPSYPASPPPPIYFQCEDISTTTSLSSFNHCFTAVSAPKSTEEIKLENPSKRSFDTVSGYSFGEQHSIDQIKTMFTKAQFEISPHPLEGFYTHKQEELKPGTIVTLPGSHITQSGNKLDMDDDTNLLDHPLKDMLSFHIERYIVQNSFEEQTLLQLTASDNTGKMNADVFSGFLAKITTAEEEYSFPLTMGEVNQIYNFVADECTFSQPQDTFECQDNVVAHLFAWAFHTMEDHDDHDDHDRGTL